MHHVHPACFPTARLNRKPYNVHSKSCKCNSMPCKRSNMHCKPHGGCWSRVHTSKQVYLSSHRTHPQGTASGTPAANGCAAKASCCTGTTTCCRCDCVTQTTHLHTPMLHTHAQHSPCALSCSSSPCWQPAPDATTLARRPTARGNGGEAACILAAQCASSRSNSGRGMVGNGGMRV